MPTTAPQHGPATSAADPGRDVVPPLDLETQSPAEPSAKVALLAALASVLVGVPFGGLAGFLFVLEVEDLSRADLWPEQMLSPFVAALLCAGVYGILVALLPVPAAVVSLRKTEPGDRRGSKRSLAAIGLGLLAGGGGAVAFSVAAFVAMGVMGVERPPLPPGWEAFGDATWSAERLEVDARGCLEATFHFASVDDVVDDFEQVIVGEGYTLEEAGPTKGVRFRRYRRGDRAMTVKGEWGRGNVWITVCRP
jgi:hypothetical protein